MGIETNQSYVLVPSASVREPWNRPLLTATKGAGTVKCSAIESGSSDGWSLQGHQASAPKVSTAVPAHGWPEAVRDQLKGPKPPVRGRPWYCTRAATRSPGWRVRGRSIHKRPPRRSHASGVSSAVAGTGPEGGRSVMPVTVKTVSRSSTSRPIGITTRA